MKLNWAKYGGAQRFVKIWWRLEIKKNMVAPRDQEKYDGAQRLVKIWWRLEISKNMVAPRD